MGARRNGGAVALALVCPAPGLYGLALSVVTVGRLAFPGTTKRIKLIDLRRDGGASGTWFADVPLPATPRRCHVHWTVALGGAVERFRDQIRVVPFR